VGAEEKFCCGVKIFLEIFFRIWFLCKSLFTLQGGVMPNFLDPESEDKDVQAAIGAQKDADDTFNATISFNTSEMDIAEALIVGEPPPSHHAAAPPPQPTT
jgi:hypothetical protein